MTTMRAIMLLAWCILIAACNDSSETIYNRYDTLAQLSLQYEARNLTEQQQECQLQMLEQAQQLGDRQLEAEARQRIACTYMVMGTADKAADQMRLAYAKAPADSLDFRAQTLLMLAQIGLQQDQADSARHYLDRAKAVWAPIADTDLYRIAHVYLLDAEGLPAPELEALITDYLPLADLYTRAELLRKRTELRADRADWPAAYHDSQQLVELTDSIGAIEADDAMTQIHALQHDVELETAHAQLSEQRTRLLLVVCIALALLLAISIAMLCYRRKARIAHAHELEAMRLAEATQADNKQIMAENRQLQQLYYEHLYAIIMPILNARRNKSGHIDLEDSAWELIEQNTDSVIPNFTTKMRRNHPMLSRDDIRFCCLIMMRVPNAIMADVYGIAPSSVAVRKQRMKHKLDSDLHEHSLENYLDQYLL